MPSPLVINERVIHCHITNIVHKQIDRRKTTSNQKGLQKQIKEERNEIVYIREKRGGTNGKKTTTIIRDIWNLPPPFPLFFHFFIVVSDNKKFISKFFFRLDLKRKRKKNAKNLFLREGTKLKMILI
jgi:hypothetical protein